MLRYSLMIEAVRDHPGQPFRPGLLCLFSPANGIALCTLRSGKGHQHRYLDGLAPGSAHPTEGDVWAHYAGGAGASGQVAMRCAPEAIDAPDLLRATIAVRWPGPNLRPDQRSGDMRMLEKRPRGGGPAGCD